MDKIKASIIGASGYTGGELIRILASHNAVELLTLSSRRFAGKKVNEIHESLEIDLRFETLDYSRIKRSDVVFLATPHGESMVIVKELLEKKYSGKIIDLSGDFRFKDRSIYEKYYRKKHVAGEITAVYGLPELNREEIKEASIIANPGCYALASIIACYPLLKENLAKSIAIDAKSGISGAGAMPSEKTHFCSVFNEVLAYNASMHRHLPEIEETLKIKTGKKPELSFVPHLAPFNRGITITLHAFLESNAESDGIREAYIKAYKGENFVRIKKKGKIPKIKNIISTNFIEIGCFEVDDERGRAIVVACIDNLVKGASGNAVQNMNIAFGFDESSGLKRISASP